MKLRLGTRGSALALTQSGTIADLLRAAGHDVETVVIRTEGDRSQAASFGSIGAQGVFVREIELALLRDDIDFAVHSFKDLPTASPEGLTVAAMPARYDAADVLIANAGAIAAATGVAGAKDDARSSWDAGTGANTSTNAAGDAGADLSLLPLRPGARVGTSSVRRGAWLRHLRPDLVVEPLRGNVPTRIGRLREGRYDAIVLAAAGVERLQQGGDTLDAPLAGLTTLRLDPQRFVPAPAQGALAVQCRSDRDAVHAAIAALDDAATRAAVTVERAALGRAEGGCNTAFGAYCTAADGGYRLTAMLERDGRVLRVEVAKGRAQALCDAAWQELDALS